MSTIATDGEISFTDADSPDDNAALIGGIVGGIVALLLVGGLIAFLVARSRRSHNHEDNSNSNAIALPSSTTAAPSSTIIYDRVMPAISPPATVVYDRVVPLPENDDDNVARNEDIPDEIWESLVAKGAHENGVKIKSRLK
jgi:hypothetical protein